MNKYKLIILYVLIACILSGCMESNTTASRADAENKVSTGVQTSVPRDYWPTEDWRSSTPEEQGINSSTLDRMDEDISTNYPNIQSFLVVKNGYLVFEKYYNNQGERFGKDDVHWLASATKTFTGALIGIEIKEGYLNDINQKVVDFFTEDIPVNADERLKRMEIKHLLTMTTGFDWNDSYDDSETDRVKFALERPMGYEPGERFNYDSPASNLLSAIITKTAGMNALKFADKYLFKPLGIKDRIWLSDNRDNSQGDTLLALRPRDMAKFGYLYLNNGNWDGKQIIPTEWVSESTKKHSEGGLPHNAEYGYQCWVTTDNGYNAYFAGGFGGQFIYVIPDLDLVVAITSDWDMHHEENRFLVGEYVIPAIKNE